MDLFSKLSELDDSLDITIRVKKKSDRNTITVSVIPSASDLILPVIITGTAQELDAGFMGAVSGPIREMAGLTVNDESFNASVKKEKKELAPTKKPEKKEIKPVEVKETEADENKPDPVREEPAKESPKEPSLFD